MVPMITIPTFGRIVARHTAPGWLPRAVAALLAASPVLVWGGCSRSQDPPSTPGQGKSGAPADTSRSPAPLNVVATTGFVADLTQRIGGDRVRVQSLMGPGVDPHLYSPTPSDTRALDGAQVVIYSGLKLEGRMGELFEALGRRKPVVAVASGIDPKRFRVDPEHKAPARAADQAHADPHIWFDASMWADAANAVRDTLTRADPAGKDLFAARTTAVRSELLALHDWARAQVATVPPASRVLVTAHDAFGYFGNAYGLEVKAIQGISTDSEAPLTVVNSLVDLLVQRRIGAVFVESTVPRKTIEALIEGSRARGHTVTIGGELFSDAMGPAGTPEGTYTGMFAHNVKAIVTALGGTYSPPPTPPATAPTTPRTTSKDGDR